MIWVQQVDIVYTKASRGAPGSTARNRLPSAFGAVHAGVEAYGFESYRLCEWEDFAPKLERTEVAAVHPKYQEDLILVSAGERLKLGLRAQTRQPRRPRQPVVGSIAKGEVARLIVNIRWPSFRAPTYYVETTYNVAFDEVLRPEVFVEARPTVFDLRADLF